MTGPEAAQAAEAGIALAGVGVSRALLAAVPLREAALLALPVLGTTLARLRRRPPTRRG